MFGSKKGSYLVYLLICVYMTITYMTLTMSFLLVGVLVWGGATKLPSTTTTMDESFIVSLKQNNSLTLQVIKVANDSLLKVTHCRHRLRLNTFDSFTSHSSTVVIDLLYILYCIEYCERMIHIKYIRVSGVNYPLSSENYPLSGVNYPPSENPLPSPSPLRRFWFTLTTTRIKFRLILLFQAKMRLLHSYQT